jgi:GMP synthase-like glutamine amidotransferase
MILIISTCKERLHYYEFVRPIEEIVKSTGKKFFTKHYFDVKISDLEKVDRVIICGTALKDFEYDREMMAFSWLRGFEKPVLGICAGMQILVKIFDGNLKDKEEIGLIQVKFEKDFLGIDKGKEVEVYALHNSGINNLVDFEIYGKSKNQIQAVKLKDKEFYGVMFHPEARNREIVKEFLSC